MQTVKYKDMGLVGYEQCWDYQRSVFDALVGAKAPAEGAAGKVSQDPVLILCEHPHVYTLGRSGRKDNLLAGEEYLRSIGAHFVTIDRGGDITYHGPGQLVGYPIMDIEALGLGLKEYITLLEESVIRTLARYGVESGRSQGAPGVWLEADAGRPLRKICAVGVRSSRFVTMHGFALNVTTDLGYFAHINPCGFTDRGVTSLAAELGRKVAVDDVKEIFKREFAGTFGVELRV
ncbi:MAG: lipoyl(octanoyl) transferase LipB [Rikenellaceae bacterium]|nr:lipoyl(octanoyl) transferase LipB [Rikenellaceae bacterium]